MKVVLYIRVSSHRQAEEGHSLEGQIEDLRAYCKEKGHVIVNEYIDKGNSAFKGKKRPICERMINEITSGVFEVEGLVVYSLSRFARDLLFQLSAIERLEHSGIRLLSVTETLPEDAMSFKYMTVMMGLVNEMNSEQNAVNVRARLGQAARGGYFTGGRVPFGYLSVPCESSDGKKRKKLIICDEEAQVVRDVFKLCLDGVNGKGLGIKAIAKHLNDRNIRNRGSAWTINSVHRILRATTYIGEFVYGKNRIERGELPIKISVPLIVNKELFYQVQKALQSRDVEQIHTKAIRSNNLLTGIIRCGSCGKGMCICTGKSGKYKYYACMTKLKRSVELCDSKWIAKDTIEDLVEEVVLTQVVTSTNVKNVIKDVKQHLLKTRSSSATDLQKLSRHRNSIEQKLTNLYEQMAVRQNLIDDSYADYVSGLQSQLTDIQAQIRTLKAQNHLPLRKFGEKRIEAFVEAIRRLVREQNEEAKKVLFSQLLSEVRVYSNKNELKVSGSNLGLLSMVSKTKTGTSELVPASVSVWRRDRDLNPRYAINVCRFSRPVLSTTQPSLRCGEYDSEGVGACKALNERKELFGRFAVIGLCCDRQR